MRKKSVLVIDNFAHGQYGGGQVFTDWIYDSLIKTNEFDVQKFDISSIQGKYPFNRIIGFANKFMSAGLVKQLPWLNFYSQVIGGIDEVMKLRGMANKIHNKTFDVVISNDFRDLWVLEKGLVSVGKLVLIFHNPNTKEYLTGGRSMPLLRKVFNTSHYLRSSNMKYDSLFIAINKYQKELIQSYLNGEVKTIHLGVDLRQYSPSDWNSRENIVLVVGRLYEEHKRISVIINAFCKANVEDWQLVIVGEGPDKSEYEQLVSSLNAEKKVLMTGFVDSEEKNILYKKAKVLVSASINEGLPYTYLEAMASGIPIIAIENDGAKELITDEKDGIIVKNDDELVLAMKSMLDNPLKLKVMGRKAREKIEKEYDSKIIFNQYLEYIR